jgi:hypothetical protein
MQKYHRGKVWSFCKTQSFKIYCIFVTQGAVDGLRREAGMRFAAILISAALLGATASSVKSAVRIDTDSGGQIGPYLETLMALRNSGQSVMIDGPCLSACTLVLGMIPRERICVTPRAEFGFHSAWSHDEYGRVVPNHSGTQLLMEMYPDYVRKWIKQHGGLSSRVIYLSGRELATMYRNCE